MSEDYVTLDNQKYLIRGVIAAKPVSEFTSGIRVGRANYDDRAHAFYVSFDDFSGGFGRRFMDVREAMGTIWDNPGGLDVRRARHVTLPPLREIIAAPVPPSWEIHTGALTRSVIESDIGGSAYVFFGSGNLIMRLASARTSVVTTLTMNPGGGRTPSVVGRILAFNDGTNTRRLYACTMNAAIASRYWYSANPGAASPAWFEGSRTIWDAVVWEDKIIAQNGDLRFMFAVTQVGGGNVDLLWNLDDSNDAQPIWRPLGPTRFVGIAQRPDNTDKSAVFFIDFGDGRLYMLDFYLRKAYPISIGDAKFLIDGIVWNGQIVVTDGWNVWFYAPGGGETIRHTGLFGKDGAPPSFKTGKYRITGFVDGGEMLYAIVERTGDKNATPGYAILAFNGVGWAQYGVGLEGTGGVSVNPITAYIDRFPYSLANTTTPSDRVLHVLTQSPTLIQSDLHIHRLPKNGEVPVVGDDQFQNTNVGGAPLYFDWGWFDGGFNDIDGALFYMKIDALSLTANETVKIEYRLNNDESAAFTTLGTFNASTLVLNFDPTNKAGVQFRTVQFRTTLSRGATATLSPELRALTLIYSKKSKIRMSWVMQVDVNRMVETGILVDTDDSGSGDTAATSRNVWEKLKRLREKQTLVRLEIPGLEPSSNNLRVEIADMTISADDTRDEIGNPRTTINLTLIEPIKAS